MVAAPCPVPEHAERVRNYDYRYVWIHDQCYAGLAVAADRPHPLLAEATGFVAAAVNSDGPALKPAYRTDGGPVPNQRRLGLPGHPGGTDVVGNRVNRQFQLHAPGKALPLFAAAARHDLLDADGVAAARTAVDVIRHRRTEPDAGIWELDNACGRTPGWPASPGSGKPRPFPPSAPASSGRGWPQASSPRPTGAAATPPGTGSAARTTGLLSEEFDVTQHQPRQPASSFRPRPTAGNQRPPRHRIIVPDSRIITSERGENVVRARIRRWRAATVDAWRTQLWPVPAFAVLTAIVLGVGLPRLDARIDEHLPATVTAYLFSGGPEAARTVLSAIASSLITVTSLTFSLTVVTLQLASSQFSPRLLRTFTRDRLVHASLGLLLATFVYALTVLRTVRASLSDQTAFVPQIAVTVAYLLALAAVLMLVVFLAHLARQIRVERMMSEVHADTTATMNHLLSDAEPHSRAPLAVPADAVVLHADRSGFFSSIDDHALLSAANTASAVVYVDRLPGESLIAGTPVAHAWARNGDELDGAAREQLQRCIAQSIDTGFERTAVQDVAFGLRQLVDVTVKALSPGVNDPTTAVHGLGHIAALLCELARKDLGPRILTDSDDQVRVVLRRPSFTELLELAVAQPRRYGAKDPDVLSRLAMLLREVAWSTTDPEHHLAVATQVDRLAATIDRQDFDTTEHERLHGEIRAAREALIGRWPATPTHVP
ncbi:hypothetical protein GCM10009539_02260 [Cryptosporangium japonicum]|uniref:GH15-like domain-containing protein n=2 Tax=Cryptosporangium japonicum TaxID=80872 RepID=A0ABN0TFQ4_9ACTN